MQNCVVYWLFDSTCTDPLLHGYVGITKHLPRRVLEHRRRITTDFEVAVLFTGSWIECIAEEVRLRPRPAIGWNLISGGTGGRSYPRSVRDKISNANRGKKRSQAFKDNIRAKRLGRKHSPDAIANMCEVQRGHPVTEQTRAKLRASHLGIKLSPEHADKIREAAARRVYSAELRAKLALGSKGKKRSDAHKAAIAEANRRRVVSEETRAKMRIAAKARMTPEVRAKLSATKLQRNRERRGEGNGQSEMVY